MFAGNCFYYKLKGLNIITGFECIRIFKINFMLSRRDLMV